MTEKATTLTEVNEEQLLDLEKLRNDSYKGIARRALYFLKEDFELNIYKLTKKIKKRLGKIENESLLSGRTLVLMTVDNFKQSIFVIKNPESIVLQKQPNSDCVIACWYENGEIKREELRKELKHIVPYDQFPTREHIVNLTDSNLVKKITSSLQLYESGWSDSIPLALRNFFKKIGLFFRAIFQTTSSPKIPDFEDKNTHINRNFLNLDIMNVLKFYQEKWETNSATITELSAQRKYQKKQLATLQNELKTAKDNTREFAKTTQLEKKLDAESKKHAEKINHFENNFEPSAIQLEENQKALLKLNELSKSNNEFWSAVCGSDGHENKDLNTITKELIESLADGIPDELVYTAYPHLAKKI